ncbi:myb-like protein x [Anaeramoeba flamelloides]|uniref:Myb-like protein x n=1 Tax=Anaeramoeba flamelloides TaxID=1746091 RepID=A0ABQ8Z4H0_9EUKA|nr:myb-like protein x [Anaeramoeba flamelloides]
MSKFVQEWISNFSGQSIEITKHDELIYQLCGIVNKIQAGSISSYQKKNTIKNLNHFRGFCAKIGIPSKYHFTPNDLRNNNFKKLRTLLSLLPGKDEKINKEEYKNRNGFKQIGHNKDNEFEQNVIVKKTFSLGNTKFYVEFYEKEKEKNNEKENEKDKEKDKKKKKENQLISGIIFFQKNKLIIKIINKLEMISKYGESIKIYQLKKKIRNCEMLKLIIPEEKKIFKFILKNENEKEIFLKTFKMFKWYHEESIENFIINGKILGIDNEIDTIILRTLNNEKANFTLLGFKNKKKIKKHSNNNGDDDQNTTNNHSGGNNNKTKNNNKNNKGKRNIKETELEFELNFKKKKKKKKKLILITLSKEKINLLIKQNNFNLPLEYEFYWNTSLIKINSNENNKYQIELEINEFSKKTKFHLFVNNLNEKKLLIKIIESFLNKFKTKSVIYNKGERIIYNNNKNLKINLNLKNSIKVCFFDKNGLPLLIQRQPFCKIPNKRQWPAQLKWTKFQDVIKKRINRCISIGNCSFDIFLLEKNSNEECEFNQCRIEISLTGAKILKNNEQIIIIKYEKNQQILLHPLLHSIFSINLIHMDNMDTLKNKSNRQNGYKRLERHKKIKRQLVLLAENSEERDVIANIFILYNRMYLLNLKDPTKLNFLSQIKINCIDNQIIKQFKDINYSIDELINLIPNTFKSSQYEINPELKKSNDHTNDELDELDDQELIFDLMQLNNYEKTKYKVSIYNSFKYHCGYINIILKKHYFKINFFNKIIYRKYNLYSKLFFNGLNDLMIKFNIDEWNFIYLGFKTIKERQGFYLDFENKRKKILYNNNIDDGNENNNNNIINKDSDDDDDDDIFNLESYSIECICLNNSIEMECDLIIQSHCFILKSQKNTVIFPFSTLILISIEKCQKKQIIINFILNSKLLILNFQNEKITKFIYQFFKNKQLKFLQNKYGKKLINSNKLGILNNNFNNNDNDDDDNDNLLNSNDNLLNYYRSLKIPILKQVELNDENSIEENLNNNYQIKISETFAILIFNNQKYFNSCKLTLFSDSIIQLKYKLENNLKQVKRFSLDGSELIRNRTRKNFVKIQFFNGKHLLAIFDTDSFADRFHKLYNQFKSNEKNINYKRLGIYPIYYTQISNGNNDGNIGDEDDDEDMGGNNSINNKDRERGEMKAILFLGVNEVLIRCKIHNNNNNKNSNEEIITEPIQNLKLFFNKNNKKIIKIKLSNNRKFLIKFLDEKDKVSFIYRYKSFQNKLYFFELEREFPKDFSVLQLLNNENNNLGLNNVSNEIQKIIKINEHSIIIYTINDNDNKNDNNNNLNKNQNDKRKEKMEIFYHSIQIIENFNENLKIILLELIDGTSFVLKFENQEQAQQFLKICQACHNHRVKISNIRSRLMTRPNIQKNEFEQLIAAVDQNTWFSCYILKKKNKSDGYEKQEKIILALGIEIVLFATKNEKIISNYQQTEIENFKNQEKLLKLKYLNRLNEKNLIIQFKNIMLLKKFYQLFFDRKKLLLKIQNGINPLFEKEILMNLDVNKLTSSEEDNEIELSEELNENDNDEIIIKMQSESNSGSKSGSGSGSGSKGKNGSGIGSKSGSGIKSKSESDSESESEKKKDKGEKTEKEIQKEIENVKDNNIQNIQENENENENEYNISICLKNQTIKYKGTLYLKLNYFKLFIESDDIIDEILISSNLKILIHPNKKNFLKIQNNRPNKPHVFYFLFESNERCKKCFDLISIFLNENFPSFHIITYDPKIKEKNKSILKFENESMKILTKKKKDLILPLSNIKITPKKNSQSIVKISTTDLYFSIKFNTVLDKEKMIKIFNESLKKLNLKGKKGTKGGEMKRGKSSVNDKESERGEIKKTSSPSSNKKPSIKSSQQKKFQVKIKQSSDNRIECPKMAYISPKPNILIFSFKNQPKLEFNYKKIKITQNQKKLKYAKLNLDNSIKFILEFKNADKCKHFKEFDLQN